MLNKFGKKICAGVCALSMGLGFNSNVKSDALFWDVALIAHEFLIGRWLTRKYLFKSAKDLVKLAKYLVKFKTKAYFYKGHVVQEMDVGQITWGEKWEKIKEETPGILCGVFGPILLADAAKRTYELYKNSSESSSNQKKTSSNRRNCRQ